MYKNVKYESLCVVIVLNSELFFFCSTINPLANDRFTNMPLVRIMILKVFRLEAGSFILGEASIAENVVLKGGKYTSHKKAEGRKKYYSNLSIKYIKNQSTETE